MLPKSKRLNLTQDFREVAKGVKKETANFRLMFKFSTKHLPKIGIALTKSVFKKAHQRNEVKRRASLAVESVYPLLKSGLNLVIMPKVQILQSNKERLVEELKNVKDIIKTD